MEDSNTNELMHQLISGLQGLQTDYEKLFGQYESLQKKLTIAREQYNELAKLHGKSDVDTPPLSLISIDPSINKEDERPLAVCDILELRNQHDTARQVRTAILATQLLRNSKNPGDVKIWSGPSADASATSQKLPSITESPMEQDFTVVGTPSKLGCPFASMTGKKLSSHAASVLNRYHGAQSLRDGQGGRDTPSIASGSGSRLHARTSSKSRRRSSLLDPIKAEICGIDNHNDVEATPQKLEDGQTAEAGVCPIRFLNQHSPEELATYFEKHKHELPRSHEVCVKRYQGDEQQVRELDARYGNIAQMIRGLGEKHQNLLPTEPDDVEEDAARIDHAAAAVDGERVTKWANTVSEAPKDATIEDVNDSGRESHFARPLRDIRLGESPTRPWGIPVPVQTMDEVKSEASSAPVQVNASHIATASRPKSPAKTSKCPFAAHAAQADVDYRQSPRPPVESVAEKVSVVTEPIQAEAKTTMTFTGPLVIGYGPEDAALFLSKLDAQKQK